MVVSANNFSKSAAPVMSECIMSGPCPSSVNRITFVESQDEIDPSKDLR